VSRFTIVTPNYNMGEYLEETIKSVLTNLSTGDEYYVVDGGSTDCSLEVLQKYGKNLTGWVSEADESYADAVYKGFATGKNEYLCWINSGDLLLLGALRQARLELDRNDSDFIYGDDVYIDEQSRVLKTSHADVLNLFDYMLYAGWTPLQDACFWKRSLYDRVGGMNRALKYAGDYDLFLRMSRLGNSRYVPILFSAFRRHEKQKSIACEDQYAKERDICRSSLVREIRGENTSRYWVNRIGYSISIRIRHHIFEKLRNRDHLLGADATSLECGRHK